MKRSIKLKAEYQAYAQYSAIWLFISVALGCFAYAYNLLLIIPTAATVCLTMRWFFDCLNTRRSYRMEVRYEKSRRIKMETLGL